ncbi:MAG: hypothetical protein HC809_02635 [Gammaproteobacteria bacterium]|nr:hypothetical protein [Gammaproteobacteria bacterium]
MTVARATAIVCLLLMAACNPADRRPGVWLTGEVVAYPASWAFTDAFKEIAIEVNTPYFVPHSVTIWCGSMDGVLYVGARDPQSKNWPGWVDDEPNVRLGIDGKIYEVTLVPLSPAITEDAAELARLAPYYARKYALSSQTPAQPPAQGEPTTRYWRVAPRSWQRKDAQRE